MSLAQAGHECFTKKPIVCTKTGTIYPSLTEAASTLNLTTTSICKVVNGHQTHTGGYSFRYLRKIDRDNATSLKGTKGKI